MSDVNPETAKILTLASQFQAVLEGEFNRMSEGTFRASDSTQTVQVSMNGYQWLTALKIEQGLLELGYEQVNARINEALQNARHAAGAYNQVAGEQMSAVLDQVTRAMHQGPA
jgi:DNA-binding protein YbaB